MKCPTCNNPMLPETDRIKCVVCGYSKWDNFQLRWATGGEADSSGARGIRKAAYGKYPASYERARI